MNFRTQVNVVPLSQKISYGQKILSLGSCFSVEIMAMLQQLKYDVLINPAGITFNPVSILRIIKRALSPDSLPEDQTILSGELWNDLDYHSSLSHPDKNQLLKHIKTSQETLRDYLSSANWFVITLGTAIVYEHKERGHVVNNCHKLTSDQFIKRRLGVQEIEESLNELIQCIRNNNDNDPEIIFTLSPVRHTREGLHANQLSKASCLLAIEKVVSAHGDCHYFPSYELIIDDLRDYRYFNADFIHPSPMALDYVFDRFKFFALDETEDVLRHKIQKINKALNHRPLHKDTQAYKDFINNVKQEVESLEKQYSFLNWNF